MDSDADSSQNELEEINPVLELAIRYKLRHTYPSGLSKEKKRAVRKCASTITGDNGEVLLKQKRCQVKVVTALEDTVESCSPVTLITPLATLVVRKCGEESLKDFMERNVQACEGVGKYRIPFLY